MTKKVTPLFYHKNHQKIKIFTTKSNVTFDSRNSRDIELIYICFIILKTVHTHQKNISQYFSSLEDKTLNWLRILSIILIAFNLFWLVEDLIFIFTPWEFYLPQISAFATIITIYWIGFSSLKQPTIFQKEQIETEIIEE